MKKRKKKGAWEMAEKERILLRLLSTIAKAYSFTKPRHPWSDIVIDSSNTVVPRNLKVGDIVVGSTGNLCPYSVAKVIHVPEDRGAFGDKVLLQELGGERTCWMENEGYYVLKGFEDDPYILSDKEWKFRQKVLKAFDRGDEYIYCFGGVEFFPDKKAKIWVCERYGGVIRSRSGSKPFSVEMFRKKLRCVRENLRRSCCSRTGDS